MRCARLSSSSFASYPLTNDPVIIWWLDLHMTSVKHPAFLAPLRNLLIWILKYVPIHRTLAWILVRLSATSLSLSAFLRRNWRRRPPTSQNEDSGLKHTKGDLDHPEGEDKLLHTSPPFTVEPNGEIVSLDNVSYSVSLYPNSGYIRNANRSAQSLHASIKSHKGAVSDRIASRSRETFASKSRSPSPSPTQNSIHSRSSHLPYSFQLSTMGGSPASSTFGVDSPASVRSTSPSIPLEPIGKPPLPEQTRLPTRTFSQPPDIDIISPIGTRLAVPTTPNDVPPVYFNQPLITPVMPEATQRYDRRPRMWAIISSFRSASHISLHSQKKGISLNIPPTLTDFSQYGSTFPQFDPTHCFWKTCPTSQMATAHPSRRRTILPTRGKGKPNHLFSFILGWIFPRKFSQMLTSLIQKFLDEQRKFWPFWMSSSQSMIFLFLKVGSWSSICFMTERKFLQPTTMWITEHVAFSSWTSSWLKTCLALMKSLPSIHTNTFVSPSEIFLRSILISTSNIGHEIEAQYW